MKILFNTKATKKETRRNTKNLLFFFVCFVKAFVPFVFKEVTDERMAH